MGPALGYFDLIGQGQGERLLRTAGSGGDGDGVRTLDELQGIFAPDAGDGLAVEGHLELVGLQGLLALGRLDVQDLGGAVHHLAVLQADGKDDGRRIGRFLRRFFLRGLLLGRFFLGRLYLRGLLLRGFFLRGLLRRVLLGGQLQPRVRLYGLAGVRLPGLGGPRSLRRINGQDRRLQHQNGCQQQRDQTERFSHGHSSSLPLRRRGAFPACSIPKTACGINTLFQFLRGTDSAPAHNME